MGSLNVLRILLLAARSFDVIEGGGGFLPAAGGRGSRFAF